jgi:hypothetical protein
MAHMAIRNRVPKTATALKLRSHSIDKLNHYDWRIDKLNHYDRRIRTHGRLRKFAQVISDQIDNPGSHSIDNLNHYDRRICLFDSGWLVAGCWLAGSESS